MLSIADFSQRDDLGQMPQLGYTRATIYEKHTSKSTGRFEPMSPTANDDNPTTERKSDEEETSPAPDSSQKVANRMAKPNVPSKPSTINETNYPRFGWSRSFTSSQKRTVREMRGYLHEATSIQSLLWTAYEKVLPKEIMDDFEETMESFGLPPIN